MLPVAAHSNNHIFLVQQTNTNRIVEGGSVCTFRPPELLDKFVYETTPGVRKTWVDMQLEENDFQNVNLRPSSRTMIKANSPRV